MDFNFFNMFVIIFTCLGIINALSVFFVIVNSFKSVMKTLFCYYFGSTINLSEKFGEWAIITGATDGIGKAYAIELAKRGINILLISRSAEKLSHTATYLEAEFHIKTKFIVADFSKGAEIFDDIEKKIEDLPVGILVNNVGKQYLYPMYLNEVNKNDLWDLININVGAVTMMTRLVLPIMIKNKKGAIINISSGAELQPLPLMTVYAATKVFIRNFTLALQFEYSSSGIVVQHLSPMFLNTKMNSFSKKLQKTNIFVPDATTYAQHAIATLGKVHSTTGYWIHGVQYMLVTVSPEWLRIFIGGLMNRNFRKEYQNRHVISQPS